MRNIEILENNWISYSTDGYVNFKNDSILFRCIKNEIESIINTLIHNNHHFSQIKYSKEIVYSFELPIVYQFQLLLENIFISKKFIIEECSLEPFFEVIQSPEYGGHATASVLNAINVFILNGAIVIEGSKKPFVINKVIENILNCKFAASHLETDEIALQKLSDLLVNLIDSHFGEYISSENLVKSLLKCFQISRQPRSSLLLRSLGEQAIRRIVTIVFSRSKELQKSENCNYDISLIRIIHFLSTLTFFGLSSTNKNDIKVLNSPIDELDDYISKMIKKTIQMGGVDSSTYQEVRKMGIELLNAAIESGGRLLNSYPELVNKISNHLCVEMLINTIKEPSMLRIILKCMLSIFTNFRNHAKTQLEFCLTAIQLRLANSGEDCMDLLPINIPAMHISLEQRESALNSLTEICKDPQLVVEIFQNYDCNIYCGNVLKTIIKTFVNQFKIECKNSSKKSFNSKTFTLFQRLGLNGILCIVGGIIKSTQLHVDIEKNKGSNNAIKLEMDLLRQKKLKNEIFDCSEKFNSNPSSFLDVLKSSFLFDSNPNPKSLAKFFRYSQKIDMVTLGEYLSKNKEWNNQVRIAYLSTFKFNKKSIVSALREVLATFKLPGESQQIERIMESFSHEYFIQQDLFDELSQQESLEINQDNLPRIIYDFEPETNKQRTILLDSSDTIFILSYSIIMLNTDLHNSQVKNKMSIDDFIKNNKGINNGKDLPKEFLTNIFETIKNNEIKLSGLSNITKHNRFHNQIDSSVWTNWISKFFIERYPICLDSVLDQFELAGSIHEELLETILEAGSINCIFTAFENSNDIQTLFRCVYGILQVAYLCHFFSKRRYINEILKRLSKYINLDLSAKCQLVLPVFIQISELTLNTWKIDSPWETILEVLFSLNSIKIVPHKSFECEELTDNQGRPISNYSNVQYPKLCFFPRAKTFGISHGFEPLFEIVNKINDSPENLKGIELNSTLILDKNLHILPLKLTKPNSSNNNHWLSDITNILFRSIEEDDEESSKFSHEPPNIVDSIMQIIIEEDIKNTKENLNTPSEIILSWVLNGSSPYLSLSIYAIIQNLFDWESCISNFKNTIQINNGSSSLINSKLPTVSGNSWEMIFHLISDFLNLCDILIANLKNMSYTDFSPLINILKSCVESFPFSDKQCSINIEVTSDSSINIDSQTQFNVRNNKITEKETYSDWSPLIVVDKNKIVNFRRISDPLCSISILMSLLSQQINKKTEIKIISNSEKTIDQYNKGSLVALEVFNFFLENLRRYSIFGSANRELIDNMQADRKNIETSNYNHDTPRSLSRSEFMFAERIITNSLLILVNFCESKDSELVAQIILILEALLQLHPIIFSLHSERIIAVFQIIMRPEKTNESESIEPNSQNSSLSSTFPTERCVLLMLGILQRMVYIPSVSVLENRSKISPEFYPGKLSDPQILILSSLECLGMWLYNPKYSSLLYNNTSLIIQTLVTFAIFTPTSLNGNVIFTPIDCDATAEYNYDANLQAISLIFSLYSLFANFESKILISQVVHTLCIAASFGPNIVRNHTINRIQQTLGSQHLSSSWFVSDPWIWLDLIEKSFLPLITFDFEFPYCLEAKRTNDNTLILLAQQFKNKTAKYVLGEDTVYKRQVQSITIVSKIILARIDLLLVPISIPCDHRAGNRFSSFCDCETSENKFLLLIPVLVNLINVLVKNSAGSSSVFFSETIKNFLLVVLSTHINATYDELLLNPILYYRKINEDEMESKLCKILKESLTTDISGIISSVIDNYIKKPMPEVASELYSILESLKRSENYTSQTKNPIEK
ncbi:SEC7 domain-containing protein [Cryptosporidium ubiquitum]|uniref:SEC7 domain-containing protein n=1 Tax=Cryptosporidium ubiquitum TaxID=857276 RepID=A0A1J4MCY1_9CRYT|nr:SEC7 domain-containing protein [Cryptosporidium ubiquitum]OII72096.1 SEC7 domain-containing protein [Cryptosporidium ubiquitum]